MTSAASIDQLEKSIYSNMKINSKTIVIKLGTSSLCDEVTHEHKIAGMSMIVETVIKLRRIGHQVIIVSSGGIAVGLKRLKLKCRPKHLASVQAVAAAGQARLIGLWDNLFRQLDQPIAQVLLTRNDIADRTQYLNAANTLQSLLHMGVVPIVNENDTLSTTEIRFGDNDTLSAITAGMVNADYLFIMTDVHCLYTDNPRSNRDAKPVLVVNDLKRLKVDASSPGSSVGTGGMTTKLIAAELATSAGVSTIICKSSNPDGIVSIMNYLESSPTVSNGDQEELFRYYIANNIPLHTRFVPTQYPIKDRQFWILHGLSSHGSIYIDKGAYAAITRSNKAGLLPVGVAQIEGHFHASECVDIYVINKTHSSNSGSLSPSLEEDSTSSKIREIDFQEPLLIGRALVNYSSVEVDRIKGLQSTDIEDALGYADSEYIAFRDNMAFFAGKKAHEVVKKYEK